jgi:hypothetical protein
VRLRSIVYISEHVSERQLQKEHTLSFVALDRAHRHHGATLGINAFLLYFYKLNVDRLPSL